MGRWDVGRCDAEYTKSAWPEGTLRSAKNLPFCKKRESNGSLEFALMMAEYCLSQQIKAFGDALQSQYVDTQDECQRYGANHSVFDQLPPVFTVDDLRALKRGSCCDVLLRKIISRWMRDGWIEKIDQKHWGKVTIHNSCR